MNNPISETGEILKRKFSNDNFHFEIIGTTGGKTVWDCQDTIQLTDKINEKTQHFTKSRRTWYNKFKTHE